MAQVSAALEVVYSSSSTNQARSEASEVCCFSLTIFI